MSTLKEYGKSKDIYIWFNEEIDFYKDIQRMLLEQKSKGNILFAITSVKQPFNSSDVLFPFDKFTNENLFEDSTREYYKECCRNNLDIVFDCLEKMFFLFRIEQCEIFVVEGYDDFFLKKKFNLLEMKKDILTQIENNVSITSCIYYLDKIH